MLSVIAKLFHICSDVISYCETIPYLFRSRSKLFGNLVPRSTISFRALGNLVQPRSEVHNLVPSSRQPRSEVANSETITNLVPSYVVGTSSERGSEYRRVRGVSRKRARDPRGASNPRC